MTFSIVGRCSGSGMLGVAITTSSICVASRCPWARAGLGALSTQNVTDPGVGPALFEHLAGGLTAPQALALAATERPHMAHRQITLVDAQGRTAHHTGAKALGRHAVAEGAACVAAGNLLTSTGVPAAMVESFAAGVGLHLAERLLRALEAGIVAGGEEGPVKSAGLLVVHEQVWPLVDLRVDWDDDAPVKRLRDLWAAYEPQMNDYLIRALDPDAAPSYGVPGDA